MGFLDDAGVSAQDAPADPFGFGKEHWPVQVIAVDEPKVTNNGERFGMMVTWRCVHPKFANMEKLGYGNWVQLPVPKALQGTIPWDKDSEEGKKVLFQLVKLFEALGFKKDEMGSVDGPKMVGRMALARISVKQDDEGFWKFNLFNMKPAPQDGSADGLRELAPQSTTNGMSEEDIKKALEDDLNDA